MLHHHFNLVLATLAYYVVQRTALRASSSRFPSCLLPCAAAASANGLPPGTSLSSPPAAAAAATAAADFADLAAAACAAVNPELLSLGSVSSSNSAQLEKSPLLLYARESLCTSSESVAQEEPRDDFFAGLRKDEGSASTQRGRGVRLGGGSGGRREELIGKKREVASQQRMGTGVRQIL